MIDYIDGGDDVATEINGELEHDALVRKQPPLIQFGPITVTSLNGEFYVYVVSRCGFSVFETEDQAIQLAWQLSL